MTTIYTAILNQLNNDADLIALATGGIHDSNSAGRQGMRRELLAVAGQTPVNPGIFIRWSSDVPFGVAQRKLKAQRMFAEVYLYQDSGYETVRKMRQAVRNILEYQPIKFDDPDHRWMADIFWRGDVLAQVDDVMGGVCFERSRYEFLYKQVPEG